MSFFSLSCLLDFDISLIFHLSPKHTQTLVSYDQFNNLVLMDAMERRMVQQTNVLYYADLPLGLYVVRGDSMVLAGHIPHETETATTANVVPMKQVTLEELDQLQQPASAAPLEWDFDTDLIA